MAERSEYDIAGQTQGPTPDKDLPGYKYAKALCESARANASKKTKTFKKKWDFFLGRGHWKSAATSAAAKIDEWSFRGVVNWLFATVKTKAAMITGATPEIFIEGLDDASTYRDRQLWKSALEHELQRVRLKSIAEDVYLNGAVTYVGVAMVTAKPDPLTGATSICLKAINPADFYCDPSADSITDPSCRFVVWEPELDMSTVREMWPDSAARVKPTGTKSVREGDSGIAYSTTGDKNLIYGSAGDFLVDPAGVLQARKVRVQFVWIKDESLTEDIAKASEESAQPIEGEIPDMVVSRKYPYGRLIVYTGDTLLYDGENPYELENVFPFSVYHHERIPGDFYGTCDTDLLESLQEAQNTAVTQLIDYCVLSVNGPFEYPVGAKSYTEMGNGPAERHPVPDHLAGKAHFISPQNFNVAAWSALHGALDQHFQVVSGLASLGLGQTSSPPISATEAEIANNRLSDRMRGHADRFSQFLSDTAENVRELMVQFYSEPMNIPVMMPNSEVQSTMIEVQSLPKVRVKVIVNTEQSLKDKLLGQNLAQGLQSGVLDSPHAELFLEAIGTPANRIKEVMEKKALDAELQGPVPPPLSIVGGEPDAQLQP